MNLHGIRIVIGEGCYNIEKGSVGKPCDGEVTMATVVPWTCSIVAKFTLRSLVRFCQLYMVFVRRRFC